MYIFCNSIYSYQRLEIVSVMELTQRPVKSTTGMCCTNKPLIQYMVGITRSTFISTPISYVLDQIRLGLPHGSMGLFFTSLTKYGNFSWRKILKFRFFGNYTVVYVFVSRCKLSSIAEKSTENIFFIFSVRLMKNIYFV